MHKSAVAPWSPRSAGATYLGDFAADPIEQVRCAFIGVGARGKGTCERLAAIEGARIVAICDLQQDWAEEAAAKAAEHGHKAQTFSGTTDCWQRMLGEVRPDAVFISTPWEMHAGQAIAVMEAGAHAFVELPLGVNLEEMWRVVDTAERTRRHCMLLENCNYGREELLYLNMVRQGLIGDLIHGEAAYIHELREQMKQDDRRTGSWRTYHYARRSGNLYPSHGLGPVAQYMNLARSEDNFRRLVSFSSPGPGRREYARKHFPEGHVWNTLEYPGGGINTSIIKTELGRTIMVQWDETSPRPYSRHNLIQGTRGILKGFPNGIAIEGVTESYHEWATGEAFEKIAQQYEHPLFKRLGDLAQKVGGHGGMDYIMLCRIIECLQRGEPLDQNLYEGIFWSAVGPLTEKSVHEDGAPQDFPDFTRGDWKHTRPLAVVE